MRLQNIKQGDQTVTQFYTELRPFLMSSLQLQPPPPLADFNIYIFKGLNSGFRDIVTTLAADPLIFPSRNYTVSCSAMSSFIWMIFPPSKSLHLLILFPKQMLLSIAHLLVGMAVVDPMVAAVIKAEPMVLVTMVTLVVIVALLQAVTIGPTVVKPAIPCPTIANVVSYATGSITLVQSMPHVLVHGLSLVYKFLFDNLLLPLVTRQYSVL